MGRTSDLVRIIVCREMSGVSIIVDSRLPGCPNPSLLRIGLELHILPVSTRIVSPHK